ncbi:MAG: hypothetical protein M3256_02950, partial [Actinomycetota bacterium]|nr:hypothetical protein [Actinomycetota bacterium]
RHLRAGRDHNGRGVRRLRSHARSHNLKLSSLAASLVERTLPDDQMSSIVGTTGSDTTKRPNRPAVANSVQA